jgi:molybdate transport system regulatory protein
MPKSSSHTTLRIRITCGPDIAIGQGKADLLEAIGRTGSISAAARDLQLSYRKAWLMVSEMNQCFRHPVVIATKGGTKGGGALLTPAGQEALARYRTIQTHAMAAITEELKAYRRLLLPRTE